jgi:Tfp pilus assembly protein PilN
VIRINLLPADLRRGTRISPKVLAAAFASAVAVSGAVGWFGIVYFGDLGAVEQQLAAIEQKLTDYDKTVKYHDQLQVNRKDYAARVQTIQDIAKSRRLWSKFLDELIDVVNNNGDTERHLAWLDSITVKTDARSGTTVKMPGNVQDQDKSRVANFHEDLEGAPFAADLSAKSDPTFQLIEDKNRIPAMSLKFPLDLRFKPTVEDPKAKKGKR